MMIGPRHQRPNTHDERSLVSARVKRPNRLDEIGKNETSSGTILHPLPNSPCTTPISTPTSERRKFQPRQHQQQQQQHSTKNHEPPEIRPKETIHRFCFCLLPWSVFSVIAGKSYYYGILNEGPTSWERQHWNVSGFDDVCNLIPRMEFIFCILRLFLIPLNSLGDVLHFSSCRIWIA